jgi:hypothetical protein
MVERGYQAAQETGERGSPHERTTLTPARTVVELKDVVAVHQERVGRPVPAGDDPQTQRRGRGRAPGVPRFQAHQPSHPAPHGRRAPAPAAGRRRAQRQQLLARSRQHYHEEPLHRDRPGDETQGDRALLTPRPGLDGESSGSRTSERRRVDVQPEIRVPDPFKADGGDDARLLHMICCST